MHSMQRRSYPCVSFQISYIWSLKRNYSSHTAYEQSKFFNRMMAVGQVSDWRDFERWITG